MVKQGLSHYRSQWLNLPVMALPTREFGTTGLTTTSMGLGMAALGRPGYINVGHHEDLGATSVEALRLRADQVLDEAYAGGIRHIDTARSYGRGEEFVGQWLAKRGHQDVLVSSKWGYTYTADWNVEADVHEVKDHSVSTFRRQIAESRRFLDGNPAIYQVHSATMESGIFEDRETLSALSLLAEEGVRIGLSVSGPGQSEAIRRALQLSAAGHVPFVSVQATWNIYERAAGEALLEASTAGWGVIVKESLANGLLTTRGGAPEALAAMAARRQVGVDAIAMAAAAAQPFKPVVLSGAATTEHLLANLRAASITLIEDELTELAALRIDSAQYWQRRGELAWG